ncbi:MAG: hypothetical protein H7243_02275 [Sphingomonadaceae bacterium]|nr:hypothetical protein [Sphingomonadaceae bacterium]
MADDDDRVGYGRPPRHSRFKPGQSGDPRGRRPGAKGATAVIAAALAEKVAVTESSRRRRITKLKVLTKQFVNRAAGGDLGSGRLVFGLIATAGDRLFDHGTAITPDDEAALTRAGAPRRAAAHRVTPIDDYRTLLCGDLSTFVQRAFAELFPSTTLEWNWHIDAIVAKLDACRRGEIRRLVINVPPRSLKSLCASVALPAFILGHDPTAQLICASHGQDFADKLARDTRTVMQSRWCQAAFGRRALPRHGRRFRRSSLPTTGSGSPPRSAGC